MRTWVKVTVGGIAILAIGFAVLAGTGAYFVFRNMEKRTGSEAEAIKAIEAVRARFGTRPPLVELTDPRRADVKINRATDAAAARVTTVHIMNWERDTGELMQTAAPLWLLRFSSVNIASQLGIAPANFRLTVSDIERYGPGIVVDYGAAGSSRVLVWVD